MKDVVRCTGGSMSRVSLNRTGLLVPAQAPPSDITMPTRHSIMMRMPSGHQRRGEKEEGDVEREEMEQSLM